MKRDGEKAKGRGRIGVIVVGAFFIFLMIFSALAMWEPKDDSMEFKYNNHVFVNNGNSWESVIGGQKMSFQHSPRDLENISVSGFSIDRLGSDRVYLLYEPNDSVVGSFEMQRIAGFLAFKGYSANEACTAKEGCGDFPVFNCSDTGGRNTLFFKESVENKIYFEDGCVVLNYENLGLMSDLFAYKVLGVM